MKILIIAATHGNELLGIKLYERLLRTRSSLLEHTDFVIGNPRAYSAKKRYIAADLNRSYGTQGVTYEHQRAIEIQAYIAHTKPDIVLDMHTTNCAQPNCLIVHTLDGKMKLRYMRASHISTILQVQPMGDIAGLADNIIGYEVPNKAINSTLLDHIVGDMQRFVDSPTEEYAKKRLFRMQCKIYKQEVTAIQTKSFVNFEQHPLGYVPIMTGENSYKRDTDYLGFKASVPEEITV